MPTYVKRKSGHVATIRVKGYPTKSKTFPLKTDAKAWAEPIEAAMKAGTWRGIAALDTSAEMTVAEAIERFIKKGEQEQIIMERHGDKNAKGIYNVDRNKRSRLSQMARCDWAQYALTKLPPFELIEWRDERLETKSPSTVKNDLNALSSVYRIARKEWQMIGLQNPLEDVARPGVSDCRRDRRLAGGELERLLEACGKAPPITMPGHTKGGSA